MSIQRSIYQSCKSDYDKHLKFLMIYISMDGGDFRKLQREFQRDAESLFFEELIFNYSLNDHIMNRFDNGDRDYRRYHFLFILHDAENNSNRFNQIFNSHLWKMDKINRNFLEKLDIQNLDLVLDRILDEIDNCRNSVYRMRNKNRIDTNPIEIERLMNIQTEIINEIKFFKMIKMLSNKLPIHMIGKIAEYY